MPPFVVIHPKYRGSRPSLSGTKAIHYLNTLGFDNASPASKPTHLPIWQLSVCGSQVHSTPALASAHTLPDSLSPALKPTSLVHSLYNISGSLTPYCQFVKRGIDGVHHVVGAKYLQSYINEYEFRYNHRKDEKPMFLTVLERI